VVRAREEGRPFALAFVDMRMPPGWGGIETVTRMWEVQPDLQVVICTAYSDYSWDELFKRLGRSDRLLILKKPFDNIEVQQLATALTEKWRVTQQARWKIEDLEKRVEERAAELEATLDQLAQSRKMEAIGQLAGGVAHDYNNILTATLIQLGLLSSNPEVTPSIRNSLRELEKMAHRAASLTRQLLTFSRQQVIEVKAIDLNELIDNLLKMLRHLLGENIRLDFQRGSQPMWIEGDCGMIEQVVTNLCVNARDAMMPRGGRLTIATVVVTLDSAASKANDLAKAGSFVRLTVTDTGSGMDAETLKRIFEPFFTTKQVGKGTGLGLATVFGITKQHQGWIDVRSAINEGSTFTIFLPLTCSGSAASTPQIPAGDLRNGSACILLVEDEQMVRQMVSRTLQKAGHRVLEAADGISAIKLWAKHRLEIDLLLSDMVMPNELTGLDLARRFKADRPELKVVITSGYSVDIAQSGIPAGQDIAYLGKPYEVRQLTAFIRNCLRNDAPAAG
jgi:signal transduction histidine kinase